MKCPLIRPGLWLVLLAVAVVVQGCRPKEEPAKVRAPRPYLAWEDAGEVETARYYFNDQFLGIAREGFLKQMEQLERLSDETHIHLFIPMNRYSESSDSFAPIPFHRVNEMRKQFDVIVDRKNLQITFYAPEFSREVRGEVPGLEYRP